MVLYFGTVRVLEYRRMPGSAATNTFQIYYLTKGTVVEQTKYYTVMQALNKNRCASAGEREKKKRRKLDSRQGKKR